MVTIPGKLDVRQYQHGGRLWKEESYSRPGSREAEIEERVGQADRAFQVTPLVNPLQLSLTSQQHTQLLLTSG